MTNLLIVLFSCINLNISLIAFEYCLFFGDFRWPVKIEQV